MSRFYLFCPEAFTPAECDSIIALGTAAPQAASVFTTETYGVDKDARDVQTSLLARDGFSEWLFERLDELFARGADEFGLPVGPLHEDVQILRYGVGNHFLRWHTDGGLDRLQARKISMSVELSERADYDGGELEVVPELVGRLRTAPRGTAHLFPSRALHRVTPVTRGVRWSLVAWTG